MRNGNDIVLELLTPVAQRHMEPDIITHVLFGECNVGACKSCAYMGNDKQLGRLVCSCDCHQRGDSARHKAGAA